MKFTRIAHVTTVHSRYDTRIFLKECRSLANAGYFVDLIVADGKGEELKDSVRISDVGAPIDRIDRIRNVSERVFQKAKAIDADLYHLHDPELLPIGIRLKKIGKPVVFDAHEDLPKQILNKAYIAKPIRPLLASAVSLYENYSCRKMNGVVAATPSIREKFKNINANSIDINNYPLKDELAPTASSWLAKRKQVCYIGGMTAIRGVETVVTALQTVKTGARLQLGGLFEEPTTEAACKRNQGWSYVDHLGFLSRDDVRKLMEESVAGIVTFYPAPNHINSQPNKMFEYMSAGIPVIASNFPLWREIIEGNKCGICVNPKNPIEISEAIDYLINNLEVAEQMGRNGRNAIDNRYNWEKEAGKLIEFYDRI
jgi:glycosyltransferase involved in cell wall biosynthesis